MKRAPPILIAICALLATMGPGAAGPPGAEAADGRPRFDCYAAAPRSHWYEIGDYRRALEELQPLAASGCAPAQRLLAAMYAKGQGVRPDLVRAYAWLLAAFSKGATPFGGSAATALGDDPNEFEIVQFGAWLTQEQLARAETLAPRLVNPRAIAANGAIGPTGVADAIKELRPRRAGYRLNGKQAILSSTNPISSLLVKANPGGAFAQLATAANSGAIPHELAFVEAKLRDIARGVGGGRAELARELDLAASQGARFQPLDLGAEVRIVRFGVNAGFASQVELVGAAGSDLAGQRYWVDNCFLKMNDPGEAKLLREARGDACDKPP